MRNAEAAQIEIEKTDEGTIEQAVRRGMSGFAPLKEALSKRTTQREKLSAAVFAHSAIVSLLDCSWIFSEEVP